MNNEMEEKEKIETINRQVTGTILTIKLKGRMDTMMAPICP